MPITSVTSDPEAATLTVIGDYPVPVRRLWDAYADPRQIERFWGPPTWPATFTRHDMVTGGRSHYFMTGPDGETSGGYWTFVEVIEGERIVVVDGFAGADGTANDDMPSMQMTMTFESTPAGSRFTCVTDFPSVEAMEQVLEMGMMEGMSTAPVAQIDDVVADLASFAADVATQAQRITPTQVRVSRVVRGTVDQVWRAHNDPDLVRRWMLGPDGWTMPVCEHTDTVGGTYRWEWESTDGSERFGFEGTILEQQPPHRQVFDQRPIGAPDGSGLVIETTLRPVDGGTLLVQVMTAPDEALIDEVLGSGMTDGMEVSFARLESILA
ncbi:MAG: SRPBCC domain-containing protein [Acidimicrobiales bacterium]